MDTATALADHLMYEAKSGGKDSWEHRLSDTGADQTLKPRAEQT